MPRILIADDNSNIHKMVSLALHDAGIEVVSVSNGGAAIRSLTDTAPDLVLADVFMPVRSGYEVCEFIKHEPRFSHVPVVLLVGAFDPLDESEARRVSADGILKKPFIPPDPLINLVKALLAKSLHERPEPVRVQVGVAADQQQAGTTANHAGEASAELSEPTVEEHAGAVTSRQCGIPQETLAFESLLQAPVASEVVAEPPEIPELDDVVPPHFVYGEMGTSVSTENETGRAAAEAAAESAAEPAAEAASQVDSDAEPGPDFEFSSDVSQALEPDEEEVEAEALPPFPELEPRPWESEALAVPPVSQPTANLETVDEANSGEVMGGSQRIDIESIEPVAAEAKPAAKELHAGTGGAVEAPAAWAGLTTPVFPGSEKIWAAPAEAEPVASQVFAEVSTEEEAKPEIATPQRDESGMKLEAIPVLLSASEVAEIGLTDFDPAGFETNGIAAHLAEPVTADLPVELPAPAAEVEAAAECAPSELPCAAASIAKPFEIAECSPAVQPATSAPLDPELIEAVVTRIVDRMQPKVIEVVTREILRPLVEALVRREINKNS